MFGSGWVRDVSERVFRQVLQTAVPVLLLVVSAQGKVDPLVVGVALVGAVAVTGVKAALVEVAAGGWAPHRGWLAVADRAVPAAAGVLVGVVPQDVAGWVSVDWRATVLAAVSAAVLAVAHQYVSPPAPVVAVQARDGFWDAR